MRNPCQVRVGFMKSFLNCSNSGKAADPAEVKAVLFAVGACVLFIGFLTAVHRSEPRRNRTVVKSQTYPPPSRAMPVPPVEVTAPPPSDLNARFRVVPASFRGINFMTRSYGTYQFSDGTNRELVLIDGKFRDFGDAQNWIDLNDVFYTDLTGDGRPEAIVLMTHLECGKQCDGGKSLVYVYSQDYPMQEILKYESGSGMDGCSLKSLTVKKRQLTLDLFGKCPQQSASGEMLVGDTYDLTRTEYFFNGKQLVPKRTTFLTVPNHYEVTNGVQVRILDNSAPLPHEL